MHVVDLAAICGVSDAAAFEQGQVVVVEFEDVTAVRKLWGMVLLMAVRDRATSVHYHPWREYGALSYVVDYVWYRLVPPACEFAGRIIEVARELFTPAGGWFRRSGPACAAVELDVWGNRYVWDAVVWSSGPRAGVELFRVTPLE